MKIVYCILAVLAAFAISEVIRLTRMIRRSKADREMIHRIERNNAALDMLEALEANVACFDHGSSPTEFVDAINLARLAIHKARRVTRAAA